MPSARTPLLVLVMMQSGAALAAKTKVRVGMFGATFPPWAARDAETGEYTVGFHTEFYTELGRVGDFDIEFVPFPPDFINDFTGTVTRMLAADEIDLGWDSPGSGSMLAPGFLYTPAMLNLEHVVLTKRTVRPVSVFSVFDPFTTGLWLTLLGTAAFGALIMALITAVAGSESVFETAARFPGFLYHTLAALLGGEEYDLYHCPLWGRLYRLGLLWLVLITSATYTANLAAYLTKQDYVIHGPKRLEHLKRWPKPICYRWPQFAGMLKDYVGELLLPDSGVDMLARIAWAQDNLQNGTCDAILDINVNAKPESLQNCRTMHLNTNIAFLNNHNLNLMRGNDTELNFKVSKAIMDVRLSPAYPRILKDTIGFGTSCEETLAAANEGFDSEGLTSITVERMSGTLVIFAAFSVLALASTLTQRLVMGRPLYEKEEMREEVQNEKLDAKLDKVLSKLNFVVSSMQGEPEGAVVSTTPPVSSMQVSVVSAAGHTQGGEVGTA